MAEKHLTRAIPEQQLRYQCLPLPAALLRNGGLPNECGKLLEKKHTYDEIVIPPGRDKLQIEEVIQDCNLPVRLSLNNSFYGIADYTSFFSNENIDVHFAKEMCVAIVKLDFGWSRRVRIPLNSDIQVSIVDDASADKAKSKCVATHELFKVKPLPQIVMIEKGCSASKKSSAFIEGETLIILREFTHPNTIKCYSLYTEGDKWIHKSSRLLLIANPSDLWIYFSDLKYLELPLQVKLRPRKKSIQNVFSAPCTIESLSTQKSVITTFSSQRKHMRDTVYEILADVPMSFRLVQLSGEEKKLLSLKSKSFYDTFTPSCITKVIMNVKDGGSWLEQELYQMPRMGKEGSKGIKLFPPTMLAVPRPPVHSKQEPPLYQQERCPIKYSKSAENTPIINTGYLPFEEITAIRNQTDKKGIPTFHSLEDSS